MVTPGVLTLQTKISDLESRVNIADVPWTLEATSLTQTCTFSRLIFQMMFWNAPLALN
jgi:hypothetical protein